MRQSQFQIPPKVNARQILARKKHRENAGIPKQALLDFLMAQREGFYLAPDFEEISSDDIYLLGFYASTVTVSDGLIFWQFLRHGFPIFTSISEKKQVELIRGLASQESHLGDNLTAYADLIDAGIVQHRWLASKTWDLAHKRNDSPNDLEILDRYSTRLKERRGEIVQSIVTQYRRSPNISSAASIRVARKTLSEDILREIESELPIDDPRVVKLRRRIKEHLREYIKSEQAASEFAEDKSYDFSHTAGSLADIIKDCQCNPSLIPAYAPGVTKFLDRCARESHKNDLIASNSALSKKLIGKRIGLAALQRLPDIGFQGIEEVVAMREKLGEELETFNDRMTMLARGISDDESSPVKIDSFIEHKVSNELLPSIREMEQAIAKCRTGFKRWLKPTVAGSVSATAFSVGLQHGLPVAAVVALGAPVVNSIGDLWNVLVRRKNLEKEILQERKHYGLSLIIDLKKKKK